MSYKDCKYYQEAGECSYYKPPAICRGLACNMWTLCKYNKDGECQKYRLSTPISQTACWGCWREDTCTGFKKAGGQPETFEEACHGVADELAELVIRKQHDYGHDNINAFGEFGVLVRTNDKIARLRNLVGKEGITEPRIDAWRDIAGYAIIALMLDREWFKLDLEQPKEV